MMQPEQRAADLTPAATDTVVGGLVAPGVQHRDVRWSDVRWAAYLVHQQFQYDYPDRIHDLRQRLVIIPPERHGSQRLITHQLEISSPTTAVRREFDQFGNLVLALDVDEVARSICFTAWIVVERTRDDAPIVIDADTYAALSLREPSPLTEPDDDLRAVSQMLSLTADDELDLARRTNAWVYDFMTYENGVTGVRTTASQALAQRRGVCQDYAHIMIALCRLRGISARYVSGHLLGEGGTHAWVEVLLPDPEHRHRYIAHPFDPTHGNVPGMNYITVAVGRDYGDVAPTSGSFRASFPGRLSARKQAGLAAVEYVAPAP